MDENKKEIIKGFFVGDTVILESETELTKSQNLKPGTIGIVSINDTKETLDGWKVVDLEKRFQEAIGNLSKEEVDNLMRDLIKLNKKT
jgi:hypothetical protein